MGEVHSKVYLWGAYGNALMLGAIDSWDEIPKS